MARTLPPRLPVALAMAVIVCGCSLGAPTAPKTGKRTPVTYQAKVQKVEDITKAFSLSQNDRLKRATLSLKDLSTSLMSAFSAASAAGPRAGYAVGEAIEGAGVAGARATYGLAGVEANGDGQLTYDDETHEVTGLKGKDAEVTFKFVNEGRKRSWEATIVRSPDGTTGRFRIEVTGDWQPQPSPAAFCPWTPQPYSPPPKPVRSLAPSPSAEPSPEVSSQPSPEPSPLATATTLASPTPEPEDSGSGGLISNDSGGYRLFAADDAQEANEDEDETCTPPPPPPYHWMGGEMPRTCDSLHLTLEVVPKGDSELKTTLEATLDEPASATGFLVPQLPTHWVFKAGLPKVALDWESRLHYEQGHTTFNGDGHLTVQGDDGPDAFTYQVRFDEAAKSGSFAMTNTEAKVKLLLSGKQEGYSAPVFRSVLLSTEDDSELGTVALDPTRPRFAIVTLKDGKTIDWELYPDNLLAGASPFAAVAQGSAPAAPMPVPPRGRQ